MIEVDVKETTYGPEAFNFCQEGTNSKWLCLPAMKFTNT